MATKNEEVRGDPRQSQHRQPALCVVLKITESGGYIAHHLTEIKKLINGDGLALDLGRADGECHLILPAHYCAIRAQALATRLSSLTDKRGHTVLEAEVCTQPSGMRPSRVSMPLPAVTGS